MANYFPDICEVALLDELRLALFQGGGLALYNANHTPAQGDVLATYTAIEATFGGYGRKVLTWPTAAFTNAANEAEMDEVIWTWIATGAGLPETLFGVFVVDNAGALLYAEKFATGGVTLASAGQTLSYKPIVTLRTQP